MECIYNVSMFLCGMFIYKYFNCLLNNLKVVLWISGTFFLILSLYLSFSPEYWITGKGIRQALFSGLMSIESNFLFLLDIVGRRYLNMIVGIAASVFLLLDRINCLEISGCGDY